MDVFSRFEKEAGGLHMTATLCLLEVSRHGLLETELLALLGDPENIKPPDFFEGEEAELLPAIGKEEKNDKEEDDKKEEDNKKEDEMEKITEKFKKLVTETYVKKELEEKEMDETGNNERRPKHRKQIKFLPAREWAIIYRNLKQLLRPCGDLGEGRLDFYHRSLSKAVRRK